jgi:hypothetical protein
MTRDLTVGKYAKDFSTVKDKWIWWAAANTEPGPRPKSPEAFEAYLTNWTRLMRRQEELRLRNYTDLEIRGLLIAFVVLYQS